MPRSLLSRAGAALALLTPATALAEPILASGNGVQVAYGADGLAFDPDLEDGIQAWIGDTPDWYDFTYYESSSTTIGPFLASSFYYELDGEAWEHAGYVQGTSEADTTVEWTTTSSVDLSGDGVIGVQYVWEMGALEVTKTETWEVDGYAALLHFTVTNTSDQPLTSFRYLHLIDPADSSGRLNSTNTRNDLQDNDGDGVLEYAQSQGRASATASNDRTLALGLCDPGSEEVNFKSGAEVLVSEALASGFDGDADGRASDQQLVYLHTEDAIAAGDTVVFAFILAMGTTDADALLGFQDAQPGCWDLDSDGHLSVEFGGDDCDDADAEVSPGADETWYNGLDEDCAGDNDYDQDKDGYVESAYVGQETVAPGSGEVVDDGGAVAGGDCDDQDEDVNAGVEETWYDGIDQDCGQDDDYDQDQDGYADGQHAGDYGPTLDPGTGDEIEGTGEFEATDCDDADDDISPGVDETWYDGTDADCQGDDDYDADGDGHASDGLAYGPTYADAAHTEEIQGTGELVADDCDDTNPDVVHCDGEKPFYRGGGGCTCASGPSEPSRWAGLAGLLGALAGLWSRRRVAAQGAMVRRR